MTSPFQQALLALEIAVDALHGLSKESREAKATVDDAFAQIQHLGFDTRPTDDRKPTGPHESKVNKSRKPKKQQTLFP
jgi:hypothetical protein